MLDRKMLRKDPAAAEAALNRRGINYHQKIESFLQADDALRQAVRERDALRAHQNELSGELYRLKKQGEDLTASREGLRALAAEIGEKEEALSELEEAMEAALAALPNLPLELVPETDQVLEQKGKPRKFPYAAKSAGELEHNLKLSVKGPEGPIRWGAGAGLERSLIGLLLDKLAEKGLIEVEPGSEEEVSGLLSLADGQILAVNQLPWGCCGLFERDHTRTVSFTLAVHPDHGSFYLDQWMETMQELLWSLGLSTRGVRISADQLPWDSACTQLLVEPVKKNGRVLGELHLQREFVSGDYGLRCRDLRGEIQPLWTLEGHFLTEPILELLLEQGQQDRGSVQLPEALARRMGTELLIRERF